MSCFLHFGFSILILIYVDPVLALKCHCTERFSKYDGYGEIVPCINNTCEVDRRGSCMMLRAFEDDNTAFRCVKDYKLRNDCEDFMMSYTKGTVCTCNTGDECNIYTWIANPKMASEERRDMDDFIQATVEKMVPYSYGNPLYDGNVKKSDYDNYESSVKLSLRRQLAKEKKEAEKNKFHLFYSNTGCITSSVLLVTAFIFICLSLI